MIWDRNAYRVRKGTVRIFRTHPQIMSCALASGGGAAYLPARPHGEEAPTCGGDRRSRALAHLHLHLEHEVDLDRVVDIRRTSAAGEMLLADAIEQASRRWASGALNVLLAAYSLAAPLWQIAHPPQRLIDAFAEEPEVPPRLEPRFRSRAYPTADRYLRRSPLRIRSAKPHLTTRCDLRQGHRGGTAEPGLHAIRRRTAP